MLEDVSLVCSCWPKVHVFGSQPRADVLCTWNSMTSLCSNTSLAPPVLILSKISIKDAQNSPHQRIGKNQEACRLVFLTILSMEANAFSVAIKYKRRRMHYAVDKHSEKQLQGDSTFQICAQIRTEPSLSPVPLWRTGRSHCSCCSMSQGSVVSTMPNPREAGQQDLLVYAAVTWCLFYLLGVRKSAIAGCKQKCILLQQHSLEDLLYSPISIS